MDLFTPICKGQRIGIFAGSGVGKSTLLTMLAKCDGFDTIVVALVGERGREVREFLEGPIQANLHKSIMVVSTGDESPMMRRQAPRTAVALAEYFRDCGESVLLIVDSVTRYAHAARDVALAAGEPAVARGYTPSVFSDLPRLLERAGPGEEGKGAITGIFSVLIDGDDHNDPVADNIRGTLDGHIVLDRAIADQGRYPAINVLGSISRLADHVWSFRGYARSQAHGRVSPRQRSGARPGRGARTKNLRGPAAGSVHAGQPRCLHGSGPDPETINRMTPSTPSKARPNTASHKRRGV
jgi:flagellum-specific ATP synthase